MKLEIELALLISIFELNNVRGLHDLQIMSAIW